MVWHVDNNTASPVKPPKQPQHSKEMLYFTDVIGVPPTSPRAEWFNMVQSELNGAAKALGVIPDKSDDNQIGKALTLEMKRVKPITEGGTGAATAAAARTNLGLKSAATLDKTDVFGTSTNLVATQALVDKLQKEMNDAIPVGVIASWDHAEAPKGWLLIRNQKFSATEYPELAKLYPSLTLNDRRGTVDRALDAGRGFDSERVLGSYQADEIKAHTHGVGFYVNISQTAGGRYNSVTALTDRDGYISTASTGSSETRMKNVATNKIIKAK